ncbi:MAG: IS200/IS605 family element transposase accessory protein TnpB [Microcoleus sp. SU_5_6]|nr:IS200/IS605 family element transposase accessory protein TnpB [Microcoleus sp. SU_5_6]
MKRVEQHIIKSSHKWFAYCDEITNISRQLYNSAQYTQRQSFFYGHSTLTLAQLDRLFQRDQNYSLLPAKVAQLVLAQCADAWASYFAALKAYRMDSVKFTGKPKLPGYVDSRNIVKFNNQAISKREFKKGKIVPSMSSICIPIKDGLKFEDLCEVRIVSKTGCYVVEVVYEKPAPAQFFCSLNPELAAAIDIGLDNLATVVFSDPTISPLAINGKPLKSVNGFYNKQVAKYRGFIKTGTSRHLQNIVRNRNNFVDSYLHQTTRLLVSEFLALGVTKVAIGKNTQWKTSINLGKQTNQKFVQVPHARFIEILTYKLNDVGIEVVVGEESYTSKASFLDWDTIPTYTPGRTEKPVFSGKRVHRSWYVASDGSKIHADVNGAFNIGRKVISKSFACLQDIVLRDRGCLVVHPRRITPAFPSLLGKAQVLLKAKLG